MKLSCKYHPTKPAHFYCPQCADHYCPDCIETKKTGAFGAATSRRCIRCGTEVEWVGVGNIIEPLTARIPKIFSYGFAPWPLGLNILLCLADLACSLPHPYFILLRLVFFAVLIKYAFSVLRATARGSLAPPAAWGDSVTDDFSPVYKQFFLYVVIGAVTGYLTMRGGPVLGQACTIFSLVFVPAMVILLAATDSLPSALNPMLFGPLAVRVGKDYLLMAFFLTILFEGPYVLRPFLERLPLGNLLLRFALNYYMIIAYHLMGYVILLHHREIGYEVSYDDFKDSGKPDAAEKSPQQQLLARANVMIKEGAADEALQLIAAKLRYEELSDCGLAECYYSLVKLKGRADLLRDRGPEFFRIFFNAKKKQEAGDAYLALSAADPSFSPEARELYTVAGWLAEAGRHREAVSAYSRFLKANPGHELTFQAYFNTARIFNERLGNPEKAREILAWLEKKFPGHQLAATARSYDVKISS